MLNINIILLSICLFFVSKGYACDCKKTYIEESRQINFKKSDAIFIGSLLQKNNDNYYTIKVIEQFKGNLDSMVQIQINPCSFSPQINSTYIIYAKWHIGLGHLIVEECSISRNIETPEELYIYEIPPPPFDFEKEKEIFQIKISILQLQAKLDLNTEIDWLRNEKSMYLLQENLVKSKHLQTLFITVSALLIILIIVFYLKNRRMQKSP